MHWNGGTKYLVINVSVLGTVVITPSQLFVSTEFPGLLIRLKGLIVIGGRIVTAGPAVGTFLFTLWCTPNGKNQGVKNNILTDSK